MKFAKQSSNSRLASVILFGLLAVGVLGTVACGDLLVAPKKTPRFSSEKQALVDMAKDAKRTGITPDDMEAFKQLNKELPDPFPSNKVRGPEAHPKRGPHARKPHGHVGPVDYIPIN